MQEFDECGVALGATEVVMLKFFHNFPEQNIDAGAGESSEGSTISAAVTPPPPPGTESEQIAISVNSRPVKTLHLVPYLDELNKRDNEDLKNRILEIEVLLSILNG